MARGFGRVVLGVIRAVRGVVHAARGVLRHLTTLKKPFTVAVQLGNHEFTSTAFCRFWPWRVAVDRAIGRAVDRLTGVPTCPLRYLLLPTLLKSQLAIIQ